MKSRETVAICYNSQSLGGAGQGSKRRPAGAWNACGGNITYQSNIVAGSSTTGSFAPNATNGTCSPSGNGAYTYPAAGAARPHAVSSIGGLGSFSYDADGNMLTGNGRTATWTSFGKVKSVTQNGETVTYAYGPEHQRLAQVKTGSFGRQVDERSAPHRYLPRLPAAQRF